ncbi:MAG: sulfotransferase [Sphingomonas sp.]|nr:sulfotransferase [Sphingomonas sp.]
MLHGVISAATTAAIAAFQRGDLSHARRLAEDELAKSEQMPLLHHLLGLIDCRLGRFDNGIARLKRATAADPGNIAYRIALLRALIDAGRAAEALELSTPPAGGSAAELDLWQVRAEAAFHAGDRAEETKAWQKICEARPNDLLAWTSLARSHFAQLHLREAETAYRRAKSIAPMPAVLHGLGLTLERSNQIEELGILLDEALADGVGKTHLVDLSALKAWRSGEYEEAACIAESIDVRSDPFRLNGLKAKIADAAGRPTDAFACAIAMNVSVRDLGAWRARGKAFRSELRSREQAVASWTSKPLRLPKSERRSPAFLVGFPRSGTTLADTFLMGHSDVRVLEELSLLEAVAQTLGGIANLAAASAEELAAARCEYFKSADLHVAPDFNGLIVDKMPLNMINIPLIASLFPDAPIIFAQRHPCDCVLSAFMQPFMLNPAMANFLDLVDSADLYDAAMQLFSRGRDVAEVTAHTLVYEKLVTDPEAQLRPLIDYLGLSWEANLLDHRLAAARRGPIETPSYDGLSQPLSEHPIGRWRRYEVQLAPVLPVLLPWAERLGYRN